MTEDEVFIYSILITALFIRTRRFPNPLHRQDFAETLRILTQARPALWNAAEMFRAVGSWRAATRLSLVGILDWAYHHVSEGHVLTFIDPLYPARLLRSLGDSAPAAFWMVGPPANLESISICGSRHPPGSSGKFAYRAGQVAAMNNYAVVTGGAQGCDRMAEEGALRGGGQVTRYLPYGIGYARPETDVCQLSLVDPDEPFSTSSAMERNLLIHCSSDRSLIAHARFRQGGAWHGVQEAFRRHVTSFFVPKLPNEPWCRALIALGARPLEDISEILSDPSRTLTSEKLSL